MANHRGFFLSEAEARRAQVEGFDGPIIVKPSAEEAERLLQTNQTHLMCRHFRHRDGQERMREERFAERMIRDEKWRPEWFGNLKLFGLCDHFDDVIIDGNAPAIMSKDSFDVSLRGTAEGLKTIRCPYFKEKNMRFGDTIRSYKGGRC